MSQRTPYVRLIAAALSVAVLCLTFSLAGAQTAKPTRAVITLNNGTTVSGELVETTPAGVTVKPNPKAEPVLTPWADIKRVGGGISREQVIAEWQKTKPDQICDDCKAVATTQCATCDGTSVDPAQKQPCDKCQATGSTGKCRTPNCVDGNIPCPDTCLKASMFAGKPDQDGKRKKQFRGKGGATFWWSDGHIGELIVYEDGNPVNKGKCPRCDGTTRIPDPACKGTAKLICAACKGNGVTGPDCATCVEGKVPCATCGGTA